MCSAPQAHTGFISAANALALEAWLAIITSKYYCTGKNPLLEMLCTSRRTYVALLRSLTLPRPLDCFFPLNNVASAQATGKA